MRGYFLTYGQSIKNDNSGISRKIRSQIKTFNESGLNCSELVIPISKNRFLSILYRIPFCNVLPIWKYVPEFSNADYLYMRRPFVMTVFMRKLLKKIRKKNLNIKIVIEIPSFPYDKEYDSYKFKWLILWNDRYNRKRMKGLVDYYATLSDDKTLFGLPTIKIKNGIDIEAIEPKKSLCTNDNTFHICAVAMFKEWHGYERFLYGLSSYYKNGGTRNIVCHFVGEGSELAKYKKIVLENSLDKYVVFHGFMSGDELQNIYDISDLALGVFGMYKKNNSLSCDLKSREALARGIPMVTGCMTDVFLTGEFKYYLEFPNDDSILDIQRIIDFRDTIYSEESGEMIIKHIRNYAYATVDMKKCMQSVIQYFIH